MIRRALALLFVLALSIPAARADDPFADERKARDAIVRFLERLADEADAKGDVLAAQALAETCLHVSGVPHPNEDALREAVIDGIPGSADETAWVARQCQAMAPHVAVLGGSSRDWDVLDARLVEQLPLVLPSVRRVNAARAALGLAGMRFDAKRSIEDIRLAREAVRADQRTPLARHGRRYVIPVSPQVATMLFLSNPGCSLGLFDPGDKGVTIGTWPRPEAEVRPPPGRIKEPPWRHRLYATCMGASGNRATLRRGRDVPQVHPPLSQDLHRWQTLLVDQLDLLGDRVPQPVCLIGFGPMPPEGTRIVVRQGSNDVTGRTEHHGRAGLWALAFRFRDPVEPSAVYRFEARTPKGILLRRWTLRTTSGRGARR